MCTTIACASRFAVVVLLTHWETLKYRVSTRTKRRSTTEVSFTIPAQRSNARNAPSFSDEEIHESTHLTVTTLTPICERPPASPSRLLQADATDKMVIFALLGATDTRRVAMQPTEDARTKKPTSLVNRIESPTYWDKLALGHRGESEVHVEAREGRTNTNQCGTRLVELGQRVLSCGENS